MITQARLKVSCGLRVRPASCRLPILGIIDGDHALIYQDSEVLVKSMIGLPSWVTFRRTNIVLVGFPHLRVIVHMFCELTEICVCLNTALMLIGSERQHCLLVKVNIYVTVLSSRVPTSVALCDGMPEEHQIVGIYITHHLPICDVCCSHACKSCGVCCSRSPCSFRRRKEEAVLRLSPLMEGTIVKLWCVPDRLLRVPSIYSGYFSFPFGKDVWFYLPRYSGR